ncbi:hypothetical protein H5410_022312 [Solanum commersonii]|uniref:Uncharacterized protein n=1 Tax=Solanum commersonii TaxID=4109 RepID=A0A9J5ZGE4_SOLCO|nr:hypothetical protein H5410_022312 [Solanum commersonii]
MSITESSSKPSISQKVENPSSFNFSVPLSEESPSTPVCGVGEMDESISPATDILVCPVLYSGNMLVCSPTLVLSSDKSPNLEAQSVSKPNEGDLPEGKGPESCILTAGAELVAIQSLAALRGDVQPTFSEHELESPDQVPHKIKGTFEIDSVGKSGEQEKERQRKGKGKLVLSHSKGDKKKYVTRTETQKFMGSAIATSKAHTERTKKMRREGHEPNQPASTPLVIENSKTESKDAAKYVAKRRREAEEKRVKSKGNQKGRKKSPVKGVKSPAMSVKVKKQKPFTKGEKERKQSEEQLVKGPGPRVKNQIEKKELTREEWVEKMEQQRVLNSRVFDPNILTTFGMANLVDVITIQGWNHLFEPPVPYLHEPKVREFFYKIELLEGGGIITIVRNVQIHPDEETLGNILGVPMAGVRTIEGCKPTGDFSKLATK